MSFCLGLTLFKVLLASTKKSSVYVNLQSTFKDEYEFLRRKFIKFVQVLFVIY